MKTMTMEALAKATIPTNASDAFKMLDDLLTDEDIRTYLSQSKEDFVADQHFGLGAWIRNNWIYGAEDEEECFLRRLAECRTMLTGPSHFKDDEVFFYPPDMLSEMFLKRYYDHLKRTKKTI